MDGKQERKQPRAAAKAKGGQKLPAGDLDQVAGGDSFSDAENQREFFSR